MKKKKKGKKIKRKKNLIKKKLIKAALKQMLVSRSITRETMTLLIKYIIKIQNDLVYFC